MLAAQFDRWNSALQTGDPETVASLYADDGVLLPTVSNQVRTNHAGKVSDAAAGYCQRQRANCPQQPSCLATWPLAARPSLACSALVVTAPCPSSPWANPRMPSCRPWHPPHRLPHRSTTSPPS